MVSVAAALAHTCQHAGDSSGTLRRDAGEGALGGQGRPPWRAGPCPAPLQLCLQLRGLRQRQRSAPSGWPRSPPLVTLVKTCGLRKHGW